jgi:hypothetical protein
VTTRWIAVAVWIVKVVLAFYASTLRKRSKKGRSDDHKSGQEEIL